MEIKLRRRMKNQDARYSSGTLVAGDRILSLFEDIAIELMIREGGDRGLLVAYDYVDFLSPVYAGDWITARGKITGKGITSLKIEFIVEKEIDLERDTSELDLLEDSLEVCRAMATYKIPKDKFRQQKR